MKLYKSKISLKGLMSRKLVTGTTNTEADTVWLHTSQYIYSSLKDLIISPQF